MPHAMKSLVALLMVLIVGADIGEAHTKSKPRPPGKSRVYERKKENTGLLSVLSGFVGRIPPQNKKADEFGLEQIKDDHDLVHFVEDGRLVWIPDEGLGFRVRIGNEPPIHQHARPWVHDFMIDFAKRHHVEIGARLMRLLNTLHLLDRSPISRKKSWRPGFRPQIVKKRKNVPYIRAVLQLIFRNSE